MLLVDFVSYYYPCARNLKNYYRGQTETMVYQEEYGKQLPLGLISGENVYRLRLKSRRFWRTRLVNAMVDSETYYYQQILIHIPVYGCMFIELKENIMKPVGGTVDYVYSWREFYKRLVSDGRIQYDDIVPQVYSEFIFDKSNNLSLLEHQQRVFDIIIHKIMNLNDNLHWIFGGEGTGKSFLLSKFSKHFADAGFEVVRLALTGVASYNIHGETVDRFFGTTNDRDEVNKVKLDDHVKLYKKTVFLIDEVSMITKEMLESISSALIQVTGGNRVFGGVVIILFGELGQLLPVNSTDYIWNSRLFLQGYKYALRKKH